MNRLSYIVALISLSLSSLCSGQTNIVDIDPRLSTKAIYFVQQYAALNLGEKDEMRLVAKYTAKSDWTRSKYQRYYNGIEVVADLVILHENAGKLLKQSGALLSKLDINTTPKLSANAIRTKLSSHYPTAKVTSQPKLVILDEKYPQKSGNYCLAYSVEIEDGTPELLSQIELFLDANTGYILSTQNKIQEESVPATANTKYYGSQDIQTETTADGKYVLRDYTRGDGVLTLNSQRLIANGELKYDDYYNTTTDWAWDGEWQSEAALDAHYCTSRYYDFMKDQFGWEGIDGLGGELVSVVSVNGKYYTNAYWNGEYAHFGNGDCANYDPLTTLDVVAHEFTHGFTDYTSDLVYKNESGALNESISDIFGKALEYYFDYENFDWYIGNRFRISEDANPFRSMKDPNERNDPKYYGGDNWVTSTSDNGGVHSNSGVLNYWFYLLVEGESGTNEAGLSYSVESIGIEQALAIIFEAQTGYLLPLSNYVDAMEATLAAAEDLFGANSNIYMQCLEAWSAVGLFPGYNTIDLAIELVSDSRQYLCPGDQAEVSYTIRNLGKESFDEGSVFVEIHIGEVIGMNQTLPNPFLPGDSQTFTTTLTTTIESDKITSYDAVLFPYDNPTLNNTTKGSIYKSSMLGRDAALLDFRLNTPSYCESDTLVSYTYQLQNRGCESIPAGDSIQLELVTESGIIVYNEVISFDLHPNVTRTNTKYFNVNNPQPTGLSKVTMQYVQDNNTENNTVDSIEQVQPPILTNGYLESFEQVGDNTDLDFTLIGSTFACRDTLISYRGNSVLAIEGLANSSSFINCPDSEDFFDSNYQKRTLQFCISTKDMDKPQFAFKMLTKANDQPNIKEANFRTLLRIEVDSIIEYFYGNVDEIFYSYSVDLPSNYEGPLSMTAFVLSGNGKAFETKEYSGSDLILLDDITIREESETAVVLYENGFTLFPNPSKDYIVLEEQLGSDAFEVVVYNSIGQEVSVSKNLYVRGYVYVRNYPDGIYFAKILREGKQLTTLKFLVTK